MINNDLIVISSHSNNSSNSKCSDIEMTTQPLYKSIVNSDNIILYGIVNKIDQQKSLDFNVAKRGLGQYVSQSNVTITIENHVKTIKWSIEQQIDKFQSLFQEAFKYLVDNDSTIANGKFDLLVEFYKDHSFIASYYNNNQHNNNQNNNLNNQNNNNELKSRCLMDLNWMIESSSNLDNETFDSTTQIIMLSMVLKYWIECSRNEEYPTNIQRESIHSLISYIHQLQVSQPQKMNQFKLYLEKSNQKLLLDSSLLFHTLLDDVKLMYSEIESIIKSSTNGNGNELIKIISSYDSLESFLFQRDNINNNNIINNDNISIGSSSGNSLTNSTLLSTQPQLLEITYQLRVELIQFLNRLDTKVSWYLGHIQIDLPYDRIQMRQALEVTDTSERRQATFDVIKVYNQTIESANAIRVSNQIRENWLSESRFSPVIVVGRESRAFSNQAALFASSGYVCINQDIKECILTIDKLSTESHIRSVFHSVYNNSPESIKLEVGNVVGKLIHITEHLCPSIARLRGLVADVHGGLAPMTQLNGAVQHIREALVIVLQKSVSSIEDLQKNSISRLIEGVHRRNNSSKSSSSSSSSTTITFVELYNCIELLFGRARGSIWLQVYRLEELIGSVMSVPSAYSVLLQRPSLSGGERFRSNELEPKNEQEEVLQKLVRIGGANLYMSPSSEWVEHATDIIEAVPLFIYERTIEVEGNHTTIFEVDQEGLEQTIRTLAEHWTKNIQFTILSEHCSLAREIIMIAESTADNISQIIGTNSIAALKDRSRDIISVCYYLEQQYDKLADQVEELIEENWKHSNFITRIDSLKLLLLPNNLNIKTKCIEIYNESKELYNTMGNDNIKRIEFMALKKQRNMPAFHLLTTEAPGLVEGFIQAILEEEMTLKNIIQYNKLEEKVNNKIKQYNEQLAIIGKKVIEEFNYGPILQQYQSQMSLDTNRAILRVIGDHIVIQKQVSQLIVLYELDQILSSSSNNNNLKEQILKEPNMVEKILNSGDDQMKSIRERAMESLYRQNRNDVEFRILDSTLVHYGGGGDDNINIITTAKQFEMIENIIKSSETYQSEYNNFKVCEARSDAIQMAMKSYPELELGDRVSKLHRSRTSLSRTTARREVVSENNLHHQMSDPRLSYSCGAVFPTLLESGGQQQIRPTGSRKRYHFIYGPSRVNLGKDERRSVEIWPQFVGATDPLCAKHAREFYSLINHQPIVRPTTAAENLKVSENQWTALIRAVRNVQALFVERLGVGDIEDLAFQFNQRGGLAVAAHKEAEGYMSGPTAGYCIPKDLLFKLFVVTHQDARKLSHIGIPAHLHPMIIELMIEIASKQHQFTTSNEWERWASKQFLNQKSIEQRFNQPELAKNISDYFKQYVEMSGGVILLHMTKLCQILGSVGVPSPLVSFGRDLHAALWSGWAEKKITLGGEQVNRSVVFPMTREIPESGKLSRVLNPEVDIAQEEQLRVHMFGVYKGDDDQKPPPDVRFAWVMRAFLIMSGHYKEVALSLDEEGQLVARLSWHGFHPDSSDPEDIKCRKYLARHFLDVDDFDLQNHIHRMTMESLKQSFTKHTTVGDITITAVPGVDSEDLLGFSAETLTLLGDEADVAQGILKSRGLLSNDQMAANARLKRLLDDWGGPISSLPAHEKRLIRDHVGARIHPLVLRLRGPGDNFLRDLQAQDIAVFSIIHPQLLALNPSTLRDLMLIGRPQSALVAHDHVSQGRHRCWFERDVMLWYAAGRQIDPQGNRISKWSDRNRLGRKSIYKAFGWGNDHYQPLLGTDLREEVNRLENRASLIYENLQKVLDFSSGSNDRQALVNMVQEMNVQLFKGTRSPTSLHPQQLHNEIEIQIQYEQRVLLANRFKKRDLLIRQGLEEIRDSPTLQSITPIRWLALGGYLLLNGTNQRFINRILNVISQANNIIKHLDQSNYPEGEQLIEFIQFDNDTTVQSIITPQLATSKIQLKDRKGKMFSVKASEEHLETAVTRRKELESQSKKNAILKWKQDGYLSLGKPKGVTAKDLTVILEPIHKNIESIIEYLTNQSTSTTTTTLQQLNHLVGQIFNYSINGLLTIISTYYTQLDNNSNWKQKTIECIEKLSEQQKGKEIDLSSWDRLVGSYEEFGLMNNLYEHVYQTDREQWLQVAGAVCEILSTLLIFEKTSQYLSMSLEEINESMIWRSLAEYYSKTIDDHYSEYTPWSLDPKRYPKFQELYFDQVGILKKEFHQHQYQLYWNSHRYIYGYIRALVQEKITSVNSIPLEDRNQLLGQVDIDYKKNNNSSNLDKCIVYPIGAWAPSGQFEQLWRVYGQLRELTFIKNDGLHIPRVFTGLDPEKLNCSNRVNHVFLSPVGRTHYGRALMEGPTLNENLFISRDGEIINYHGGDKKVLAIHDGYIWVSESKYIELLKELKSFDGNLVNQISIEKKNRVIWPSKGVMIAVRFSQPVIIGSVVTLHHHRLEHDIANAGYPTTDKSPFLYELTYNKSLYPLIFNPSQETGVLLPPEIDWLQVETNQLLNSDSVNTGFGTKDTRVLEKIRERLLPFIQKYPIIIVKGAAESGARNLSRFDFKKQQQDGATDQSNNNNDGFEWIDQEELEKCSQFIFNVSKSQNVVIQRAIISSPLFWMNPNSIERMVTRQIADHGVSVELNRHPKDTVYGTLRIIMSSSMPPQDLIQNINNVNRSVGEWQSSHPIALNSLQIATNVGRQGSLEILSVDSICDPLKPIFLKRLEEAGSKVMEAMARFGPKYWSNDLQLGNSTIEAYQKRFPNVREKDASGVPIWWPRYLMLDFIAEPIWKDKRNGNTISNEMVTLIDIVPGRSNHSLSTFTLVDNNTKEEFEGEVIDVKFWQLEPNVGIGLWPNYWRRELDHQQQLVKNGTQNEINWNLVGQSDRIVLSNYLSVGKQFLNSIQKDKNNNNNNNENQSQINNNELISNLSNNNELLNLKDKPEFFLIRGKEILNELFVKLYDGKCNPSKMTKHRIVQCVLDGLKSKQLTPDLLLYDTPQLINIGPNQKIFAVIVGKETLMYHHFYPFMISNCTKEVMVIGVLWDWIQFNSKNHKATIDRCIRLKENSKGQFNLVESPISNGPIKIDDCILLELPNDDESMETNSHLEMDRKLTEFNVNLVNQFQNSNQRCDDKYWLKSKFTHLLPIVSLNPTICLTEQSVKKQLQQLPESKTGFIVQYRRNTTESEGVSFIENSQDLIQNVMDHFDNSEQELLVAPFKPSIQAVTIKNQFIIRLNACIGGLTTISIVMGNTVEEKIVSPGLRGSSWTRVMNVLSSLKVNNSIWLKWSEMAHSIRKDIDLALVGIDFIVFNNELDILPLEVNARPGSLIMAELPIFNQESGELISTSMFSPISDEFWESLSQNQLNNQSINNLLQTNLKDLSSFKKWLTNRYGDDKNDDLYLDRYQTLKSLLENGKNQFNLYKPVVISASNGRDRIFMGHSDLKGLGSYTINANTINEIYCIGQIIQEEKELNGGKIYLFNENPQYPSVSFYIEEIISKVSNDLTYFESNHSIPILWSTNQWENYIISNLAFLLSPLNKNKYKTNNIIDKINKLKIENKSIIFKFSANGFYGLPSTGGVSSSSALTGSFSLILNQLLKLELNLEQLSDMDFGEYYLGKTAGASDKTAQLFAKKGQVSIIGSFPERFITTLSFPTGIDVFMAESPIPRLTSQKGKEWIQLKFNGDNERIDMIKQWSSNIMKSFGSLVFVESIQIFLDQLKKNREKCISIGLTEKEIDTTIIALSGTPPLLRELSRHGEITRLMPELNQYQTRNIYNYKLLKLLPEELQHKGIQLYPRKSVLYAWSEVERGFRYQEILTLLYKMEINNYNNNNSLNQTDIDSILNTNHYIALVRELMEIIKVAHDGDKQIQDYRSPTMSITNWGNETKNDHSDQSIDQWINARDGSGRIEYKAGGFQRSLPEIDELADLIQTKFNGLASLRIAAAGLGGSVCIHCHKSITNQVIQLLKSYQYQIRKVEPSSPSNIIN